MTLLGMARDGASLGTVESQMPARLDRLLSAQEDAGEPGDRQSRGGGGGRLSPLPGSG